MESEAGTHMPQKTHHKKTHKIKADREIKQGDAQLMAAHTLPFCPRPAPPHWFRFHYVAYRSRAQDRSVTVTLKAE